jgi:molybdopterin-guanine dinucleotide biosynthesis protein A
MNDAPGPIPREQRIGVIVAGGRARRFGSDKALALWRGRPLIAWAHDALKPWCARIYVNGRDWGGLPALADRPRWGLGPLGGIAAGMIQGRLAGYAGVLTIACDTPDVPQDLIAELCASVPSYCPDAPVLGHWPVDGGDSLMGRLDAGHSARVRDFAVLIGARAVPAPGLLNINRPEDLTA